ncbi:hypothetical protein BMS3Abin03_01848 [bacterium BMS3Abin03]|nr:hypothetical protein BMS3Abin03_01848 [bacterium BMS3Abin03]
MIKKKYYVMKALILLITLFLVPALNAQVKFGFEFDYAQFAYDSVSNYVEFYYSFNEATMGIEHTDTMDYAKAILHVTIEDTTTGIKTVDKNWLVSNAIIDQKNKNESLIGVIGFILNKGEYKCTVVGKDALDNSRKREITEYINVFPFMQLNTSLSDIQLASNIISGSSNTSSIFYKNTFEIMPIPVAVFGENRPVLFYYTELYNLSNGNKNNMLRVDQTVYNSRGRMVVQKHKKIGRMVNSRVEVGTVMTYKLPTDSYTLVISVLDSVANYGVSSSKKFYVINPSVEYVDTFETKSNIIIGMFGVMSEEELDDFFAKSKYIATAPEIAKYESLTNEVGKREFMTNFWKARDEDPSNRRNQYLIDYMERIKEANNKYSGFSREGWQTDRGRVYLIYGEPDEIERHPNQTESRPYEIWYYNDIEGGVIFIFGDLTGYSDYTLLHSTKRGELQDPTWQRRITIR